MSTERIRLGGKEPATRMVRVTPEVLERLRGLKREGERLGDVIRRLLDERGGADRGPA